MEPAQLRRMLPSSPAGPAGPQRRRLAGQGPEIRSAPGKPVNLAHQRPGPGQAGEREVHPGQLDP